MVNPVEALKNIASRIEILSLRERGILLVTAILVIYFVFNFLVYLPMETEQQAVQGVITQNNTTLVSLTTQVSLLSGDNVRDLVSERTATVQQLRSENSELNDDFNRATANLVMPGQMARLLQEVLSNTNGVRLRKVTSLGAMPLIGTRESGNSSPGNNGDTGAATAVESAFKHGLQIEFDGNFYSTLDYMRNLENLEWKFFWDKIEFQVTDYPDAVGVLSLYTISLNKNWIGI